MSHKVIFESIASVHTEVREGKPLKVIEGEALRPTISINGNIYPAEEIRKASGLGIPLPANWEHTSERVGNVVYSLNESTPAINYRIEISSPTRAADLKEGIHKVSIEAGINDVVESCSKERCYNLVSGINFTGIAITDHPSVTTVTASIHESMQTWQPIIEHCNKCQHTSLELPYKEEVMTEKSEQKQNDITEPVKEADEPCPVGQIYNPNTKQCEDAKAPKQESETKKESGCSCKKEAESKTWIPNMDEINEKLKALKEQADYAKEWINKTTAQEASRLSELEQRTAFNKNLYSRTTITGAAKPATEDINYIAQEAVESLKKFHNYSFNLDLSQDWVKEHIPHRRAVEEAISFSGSQSNITNGMSDVFVLPGGKYLKTIRDLVRFAEIPDGADTVDLFYGDIPNQGTITEGLATSFSTHTLTTKTITADTVTGVSQQIKRADLEDTPVPLISYLTQTARAEVLHNEAKLVFNTTAHATTPARIVNGNTGATISGSSNDVASMTADAAGVAGVLQYFENQSYPTDFGAIGLWLHPKAMRELRTSSNLVQYVQNGDASITKTGRLTHLFGVELITGNTNVVYAMDNTTNDVYENIGFVKGHTFALGSHRELTVDLWLNGNKSAYEWTWSQRKNAICFDSASMVQMPTAQ